MLTIKKTLLIVSSCFLGLISIANAALPGYYLGGQIGWGQTGYKNFSDLNQDWIHSVREIDDSGFAGRAFIGYQANCYWASEFGYTRFSQTKAKDINYIPDNDANINEYAFDLVAKGILPIGKRFSAFAKLGAAYVVVNTSEGLSNEKQINPTFGGGLAFDITPHLPIGVSYTRIQKIWGAIPSTDLVTFDIAYHFG